VILVIQLKNIYYSYECGVLALKDVSVQIKPGESVAFIGPNGSGKSTLMKLINGLVNQSSGSYDFEGQKITPKQLQNDIFSKSFHKKIGFIFQNSEVQLFCSNVYDEVAFGIRQMGMSEDEVRIRVYDILRLLKVEHLKDRQPYHLSGGEKRKIAIASVLVMNPEVLVFDEPMNGLDPESKRFLKKLMIELNEAGKTILCSTHDFEYVEDVFKRVVVFSKDHAIIRDGDYKGIMDDKKFLFDNNII